MTLVTLAIIRKQSSSGGGDGESQCVPTHCDDVVAPEPRRLLLVRVCVCLCDVNPIVALHCVACITYTLI